MILELDINEANALLLSENDTVRYVMGIGDTDYTIHRDAKEVDDIYSDPHGFFGSFSINDKNNYHVLKSRITSVAGEIKWKKEIEYNGKKLQVNDAYLGLNDRCKIIYHPPGNRCSYKLTFEGEDMKDIHEHIKFVIDVTSL